MPISLCWSITSLSNSETLAPTIHCAVTCLFHPSTCVKQFCNCLSRGKLEQCSSTVTYVCSLSVSGQNIIFPSYLGQLLSTPHPSPEVTSHICNMVRVCGHSLHSILGSSSLLYVFKICVHQSAVCVVQFYGFWPTQSLVSTTLVPGRTVPSPQNSPLRSATSWFPSPSNGWCAFCPYSFAFGRGHMNGVIWYTDFWIWLLSFMLLKSFKFTKISVLSFISLKVVNVAS